MTNTYYSINKNGLEIARALTLEEAKTLACNNGATYKICYVYRNIDDTAERRERIAKNRERHYAILKEKK